MLIDGDPAGRAALWAGARGDDTAVAASCLRLLATVEPAASVERAVATLDPDTFTARADRLRADPSGKVRRHLLTCRPAVL
ncbi:hypothetical protein Drose_13890 [Dactylosporangium roseum]|uniref:Uncharacterized protein n=1 Tax=Dactylosporangium roseum TaxID=47989 RepID=A0ABY5ZE48_9ACTN|nr:hypothetical protein [Dactylosporangium roseum]UWZ39223.1 hypothetical protein Drose_13890 [Dactylosporangium roseum]